MNTRTLYIACNFPEIYIALCCFVQQINSGGKTWGLWGLQLIKHDVCLVCIVLEVL